MLRTTSYRSVKVIDIAREAGTSPATFYQYFADVEAAILVLAQEMALDGQRLVRLVAEGTWKGKAGYRTALELTDAFFDFWDQHRPCCGWSTSPPRRATTASATSQVQLLNADDRARRRGVPVPGRGQEPGRRPHGAGRDPGHHPGQHRRPPPRVRVLGHQHDRRAGVGVPPRVLGRDRQRPPA